jgi:crotonobetainyl-CoA:carnitine CoA-transferase CaiB-like acyl-CoA transferase
MSNVLGSDTFEGVTVLDLTRLLPGPFATMLFADLGARVIKVESRRDGDYARWTPPRVVDGQDGYGAFFEALNRGKESVAVDLKRPEGRRLLADLVRNADVLIESFRPGVLERLGFGEPELRRLNARLIVCRITGYGQDGPASTRAGHDLNFLARSGALGLMGPADGPPAIPAVQVGDIAGGALNAAFAVVAALYRRERKAIGATIDISMTEGVLAMLGPHIGICSETGDVPVRGGDTLSGGVPAYRVYETSDGRHLAVGALEPKFWLHVCRELGLEEHAFSGVAGGDAGKETARAVASVIAAEPLAHWLEVFSEVDACVEPVKSLDEVISDELFIARGALRKGPGGRHVALPPTSRGVEGVEARPVPLLGQHTVALARACGWTAEEIEAALDSGAIAGSATPQPGA